MNNTAHLQKIGQNIKLLRLEKSLSQEALGEEADISRSYIGKIERGEANASELYYYRIAVALDVKTETLFKDT
ncbi:helix-turn-helix domain-containing protein [Salimicrobium flavidum]|uniref:helix-turn-helix domain-containing protein n=1 Tax=Salimicrobium flavidum TaxID=570947 RepID=UPI0009708F0A|nr:helix-turn-helix transcriptional regulator [Salimicrobium flavidum]